ncbi:MAG: general secretion pathway protein GspK [Verrucomicrobiota bacterium]|nr:general secretion pathway protein GspK [Verrucomicrobiota bacterium]
MRNAAKKNAAALLLALWALFLLSALIVGWASQIQSRLIADGSANRILEAEAMACSGAEIALNPAIKPGSPNLTGKFSARQSYEAQITGEGGRLDINWLVQGEDPNKLEILRRYLELKGFDLNERDRMIDTLLDWVDADDLVRLNGAEKSDDYEPANAPLTRIEDLKKIKGWKKFTSRPGWDEELTVNSDNQGVDLQWASRDVLRALPGMTDGIVDRFLEIRRGPDGIDGTSDDGIKPGDSAAAYAALGIQQPQQEAALAKLVSFGGFNARMRVVSTGHSGDVSRTVQLVFLRVGATNQVLTWKEL